MKLLFSISLLFISMMANAQSAQKTTAVKKRIIASSAYSNTVLVDSYIHYYNSTVRGSVHTNERSYFDLFLNSDIEPQSIFCDSTVNYQLVPGRGMAWFMNKSYKYSTKPVTDGFVIKDIGTTKSTRSITYNSFNKPTLINFADTDAIAGATNVYNRVLFYNSNGKLIQDSDYHILYAAPHTKKLYSYDAKGNDTLCNIYIFDGTSWEHTSIIKKTFDSRSRLISMLKLYSINGVFSNTRLDSFTYRGIDSIFNRHSVYDWISDSSKWKKGEQETMLFNSSKLTDTLLYQYGPALDTLHRKITYYDTTDKLIKAIKYFKHLGANTYASLPFRENYFYFQTYGQTSVSNINPDIIIKISPNPSKGTMHINTGNSLFNSIVITDMQGRTVYCKSTPATNSTVLQTQLPPGNYVLSLYNQDVRIAAQKLVIE